MNMFIIFILIISLTIYVNNLNLILDETNPIQIKFPFKNKNTTELIIRFSFPQNSAGLNYNQYIAVSVPKFLDQTIPSFQLTNKNWNCTLTDGIYSYYLTPVLPEEISENNVAYCRLDEVKNLPLKSGVKYQLKITNLTISSNYIRSISLFTSTSNNLDKIILDSIINVGSIFLYDENEIENKNYFYLESAILSINSEYNPIIYPNQKFDVEVTLKSNAFINYEDHIIVFSYPNDMIKAPERVENIYSDTSSNLKSDFSIRIFNINSFSLEGLLEDLNPNSEMKLKLKDWTSLDKISNTKQPIEMTVYYKNTYTIVSHSQINIFSIKGVDITLTANHPEMWDVYQGGAWPIRFSFKMNQNLMSGGWFLLQQKKKNEICFDSKNCERNIVTFIPSTCDFSEIEIDNSYGIRPNCYFLQTLDTNINKRGKSGVFFQMKTDIKKDKIYILTVWAFFDSCEGGYFNDNNNIYNNPYLYTQPKFNLIVYKHINEKQVDEKRFSIMKEGMNQSILAQSSDITFNGKCWYNIMYDNLAGINEYWSQTTISNITIDTTDQGVNNAIPHYREIFDWVIFSEIEQTHSNIEEVKWYKNPMNILLDTSSNNKFLYSTNNSIGINSYFVAAYTVAAGLKGSNNDPNDKNKIFNKTAAPVMKDGKHPSGKWVWQFPKKWFIGNNYESPNGNCYASWSFNEVGEQSVSQLLTDFNKNGSVYYESSKAQQNFISVKTDESTNRNLNNLPFTIDPKLTYLSNNKEENIIFKIVSTFHDGGDKEQRWRIADYTINLENDTLNVSFFTSCVKWIDKLPKITSIYTYIDIQIKWNYIPINGDVSGMGKTISNIRLIKLFPETGVFQDFEKNNHGTKSEINPLISHTIYTLTHESLCLLELDGMTLINQKFKSSNTFIIWIFMGTLLESDYFDTSANYPVAPISEEIKIYGLQSGFPMDVFNPWVNISKPIQFSINSPGFNSYRNDNLSDFTNTSSYLWFMSSILYVTDIKNNLNNNNDNLLIPYYCPTYLYHTSNYFQDIAKRGLNYPYVMAAWMNTNSFNAINSLDSWITYTVFKLGNQKTVKLFSNTESIDTEEKPSNYTSDYITIAKVSLKWSPYTYTDNSEKLFVNNVTNLSEIEGGIYCTGHILLLNTSIYLDEKNVNFSIPNYKGSLGLITKNHTFYVFGKSFSKGILFGVGNNEINVNYSMKFNEEFSIYYTGVKRPIIDDLVKQIQVNLNDKVAYACSTANYTKNRGANNYISYYDNPENNFFLLDWYEDLNSDWKKLNLNLDLKEMYKNDPFNNFKIEVSPPGRIPASSNIFFSVQPISKNFNSICGIMSTENKIAKDCEINNNIINCKISESMNDFTMCCYSMRLSDNFQLLSLKINFPTANTKPLSWIDIDLPFYENDINIYQTKTIYDAKDKILNESEKFSLNTNISTARDISIIPTITKIIFSHVNQENGIGKILFIITIPRDVGRDMILSIEGPELKKLIIPDIQPRCSSSFYKENTFLNNNQNDLFINSCSINQDQYSGAINLKIKNIIYKCGINLPRNIYISLWPIKIVDFNSEIYNIPKFTVKITSENKLLTHVEDVINPLINPLVNINLDNTMVGKWQTLCPITKITPNLPGEIVNYEFYFDLDIYFPNSDLPINEFSIFFPYEYFGHNIPKVFCKYNDNKEKCLCQFSEEGILNIRFFSNLSKGKVKLIIGGITNPVATKAIHLACTVNSTDFLTGKRINLVTGSGIIPLTITTTFIFTPKNLRFMHISDYTSDANTRSISTHKFRITFDHTENSNLPITINNYANVIIYFPKEYDLEKYSTILLFSQIEEFEINEKFEIKSKFINISETTQTGNTLTIKFKLIEHIFNKNFRYWDIYLYNIPNPMVSTNSTGPFNIVISNNDYSILFRTFSNTNNYHSTINDNNNFKDEMLNWNKGNQFINIYNKILVDVYMNSDTINILNVKAGRYVYAFFNIRNNEIISNKIASDNISLQDSIFETGELRYTVSTAFKQPVEFLIGCKCGTKGGSYLINFKQSDEENFAQMIPVEVIVDDINKGIISYQRPPNFAMNGSIRIGILLSEPNFDILNFDSTDSSQTNLVFTPIPQEAVYKNKNSNLISSVYFTLNVLDKSKNTHKFNLEDPNSCYTWEKKEITFNLGGQSALITPLMKQNISTFFKYSNDDKTINKNSINFTFTSPVAPVYIYCSLVCINLDFPSDLEITNNVGGNNNQHQTQIFTNLISNMKPYEIQFDNLYRGQNYKIRCIIESTQYNKNIRTQAKVTFDKFNNTEIMPTNPQFTKCAKWKYNNSTSLNLQEIKLKMVDICQRKFTQIGYSNDGCVICSTHDLSYTHFGFTLPNSESSCNANTKFIETSLSNETYSFSVCAIPHPICTTDNINFNDTFNQFIQDFNSDEKIENYLNNFSSNIKLRNLDQLSEVLVYSDENVPDIQKLNFIVINNEKNGDFKGRLNYDLENGLICYWMISDLINIPTFNQLINCNDPNWCGTIRVGKKDTFIETEQKSFIEGVTYRIYLGCVNDIPFSQKQSDIKKLTQFSFTQFESEESSGEIIRQLIYSNIFLLLLLLF